MCNEIVAAVKDSLLLPCRQRLSGCKCNLFWKSEGSTEHSLLGCDISNIEDAELGCLGCDFVADLFGYLLANADAFLDVVVALGVEAVDVDHRQLEIGRKQLSVLLGVQADERW